MTKELLWTLKETAQKLRVCPRTIKRMIDAGQISAVRIGRCIRVIERSVHEWIEEQKSEKQVSICQKASKQGCTSVAHLRIGGYRTQMQAAKELAGVLGLQTKK